MASNDLLKTLYARFFEQREHLTEAPQLTLDADADDFDFSKADEELVRTVSYLMGVSDIRQTDFAMAIEIIQECYDNQPGWKELLIDYLNYLAEKEKESLQAQEAALLKQIEEFTQKLLEEDETEN